MIKSVSRSLISACLFIVLSAPSTLANEKDFQSGISLYRQKSYKPAIARFDKVLATNGVDYRAYYFKALSLEKLGDKKGARDNYIRAVQFGYKTKIGVEAAKILGKEDRGLYIQAIAAGKKFYESRVSSPAANSKPGPSKSDKKADSKKTADSK